MSKYFVKNFKVNGHFYPMQKFKNAYTLVIDGLQTDKRQAHLKMNNITNYTITFAGNSLMVVSADSIDIKKQIIFFMLKNIIVGYICMSRYIEVSRYNLEGWDVVSKSLFTLENNEIIEKIELIEKV